MVFHDFCYFSCSLNGLQEKLHFVRLLCHSTETCIIILHQIKPDIVNQDVNNGWNYNCELVEEVCVTEENHIKILSLLVWLRIHKDFPVSALQTTADIICAFFLLASSVSLWLCDDTVICPWWINFKSNL